MNTEKNFEMEDVKLTIEISVKKFTANSSELIGLISKLASHTEQNKDIPQPRSLRPIKDMTPGDSAPKKQ
jgi:hypothetical protein